jgi:hypothetical protein
MRKIILALIALGALTVPVEGQRLRRVVQIGEEDGAPEFTFGSVRDVALGQNNEVYVLDDMNATVRVFSMDGRHLRSFGRKGSGPGEFGNAASLTVTPAEVRIMDSRNSRIVVYGRDGKHMRTYSVPAAQFGLNSVFPMRYDMWVGSRITAASSSVLGEFFNSSAAEVARNAARIRGGSKYVIAGFHTGAAKIDSLLVYEHGFIQWISPGNGFAAFSGWPSGGSWALGGDSLVALVNTISGDYRILDVSAGGFRTRRSGRIPVVAKRLTSDDWKRKEAEARKENDLPARINLVGPEYAPQLGAAMLDRDGTLWLERLTDSDESKGSSYLRIPLDSRPQSVIQLPAGFRLRQVRTPLLIGTRKTPMGVDVVEIWSMQ